jgi:mono/diheme cytochrome c family protein
LTGPGFKGYFSNHQPKPSDIIVRAVIAKGKGKMPAFGNLNKTQTDEVIAYLKTL